MTNWKIAALREVPCLCTLDDMLDEREIQQRFAALKFNLDAGRRRTGTPAPAPFRPSPPTCRTLPCRHSGGRP